MIIEWCEDHVMGAIPSFAAFFVAFTSRVVVLASGAKSVLL